MQNYPVCKELIHKHYVLPLISESAQLWSCLKKETNSDEGCKSVAMETPLLDYKNSIRFKYLD